MIGALFALASAAFFGLNNAALRRGVVTGTVLQAMAITVPFGVPMMLAIAAVAGGFEAMAGWGLAPWLWMSAAGVVHFVLGRYGNYKATQLLGATLSTPIQQASILVALVLAFVFLGETLNAVNLLGILLVVLGPMMLVRRRKAAAAAGRAKGFEPQYGPGIFWGAICALGYGTSPLFVALGIGKGGVADGVGGLLVSYAVAAAIVAVWIALRGGLASLGPYSRHNALWFLLSGVFVGVSQVFRYVALAIAPVAVVVPIQRLSVVFRLLFNAILNRENEVFDRWVVVSIMVSVLGAMALAGDTETMLGWLGLERTNWLARPIF